jgi:non-heme chloroperoxidase
MRKILWLGAMAMLLASSAYAQDISGDWQGTIERGGQKLRGILRVTKGNDGAWHGMVIPIDMNTDVGAGIPVTTMTLQGSTLKFTIDANQGSYEGTVSADGTSITGTWKQGQLPAQPLDYRRATNETAWKDPSPHTIQFVTVEKDVKLEVLDWGGTGRPLIFLAGLGNTAHVFDKFAPKLTPAYHVYGITRRGFGDSSAPVPRDANYSADRLGDDVLAVIDALKLSRPVLVGHSIAGEELSSVGSRHPETVAGLIYLDAGYGHAYYDRSHGDLNIDLIELQKKLELLRPGKEPPDPRPLVQGLLETSLPDFERDLREWQKVWQGMPDAAIAAQASTPMAPVAAAIMAGEQKYTNISVPILAIFAVPHDIGPVAGNDSAVRKALEAADEIRMREIAKGFESGLRSARVVRLPHANHYVFLSNEADVLREMNAFLGSLP